MIDHLTVDTATQICELLGLDAAVVSSLVITPELVYVTTYRLSPNGMRLLDDQTGQMAMDYAILPGPRGITTEAAERGLDYNC